MNDDNNILTFKPKTVKDSKQRIYGVIQLTSDNKVSITMEDKVMILEGPTAFDFALLIMCAAKVIMSDETINVEETE